MSGKVRLKGNTLIDEDLPSLQVLLYRHISKDVSGICHVDPITKEKTLHKNVFLPSEICDQILEYHQLCNLYVDDTFLDIFKNRFQTKIKIVNLRNSAITHHGLELLLKHNLQSLSLWYCYNINIESRDLLTKYGKSLKSLELGVNVDLLKNPEPNDKVPVDFHINSPNLQRLVLNGVVIHNRLEFEHFQDLNYLDLTSCILDHFSLDCLSRLPFLRTLILFNVWPLANQLNSICKLKNLTTLDVSISITGNGNGIYDLPDETLEMIVENLRHLENLDISGTNLAGTGVAQRGSFKIPSDIPGIISRTERPFNFLGLYHTADLACKRHDIPAINIAGDANEKQILTAARYYYDRPVVLTRVLDDLYHIFRFESCKEIDVALDIVLSAMDRHQPFKHMQISGSATLFYIVKNGETAKFGTLLKRHIISTLLNGMQIHKTDETMLRNGYLTITQFQMPNDILFEYERLIRILLYGVSKTEQEGFVQRIAIYLLHTLACQVDSSQKLFLGDLGVVGTMLTLIKDRVNRFVYDDVMEVSWSTMWNVTDETAINCKRFLDGCGMDLFLKCVKSFPDREDLLRNMMGLLGNVAEVKWLRPRLMTSKFVNVFSELLDSYCDGIEVSYNAAGVLAHIASDGEDVWKIESLARNEVLIRLEAAIDRWNLDSERNINYRSFEPILGLLRCYHTPQCQHWAAWALANLTKVYPDKYCKLVDEEYGIELLCDVVNDPRPYGKIKQLAQMVIEQCYLVKTESANLEG